MKVKGIKIIFVFLILASILMPFPVFADTISQSDIQGVERVLVDASYMDQSVVNSGNTYKYYQFTYETTVILKENFLGWIQGTFQTSYKTYDNANWQIQNSSCTTISKSYYVNGKSFTSSFSISAWIMVNQQGNLDPAGLYATSFTLSNSNVISQNETTNQWSFPIESFTAIYPFYLKYDPVGLTNYDKYVYPLFNVKTNDIMFNSLYTNNTYYDTTLIFGISTLLYDSVVLNFIEPTNSNYTMSSVETISRVLISSNPNVWYQICKIKFHYTGTGTEAFGIKFKQDFTILPIYWNLAGNQYLSTDFALQYGLSNQLLDDIHKIASGTQQSSSAASGLDSSNSTMASDMNSMATIENGYSQDFNSQLQNIDFTNPIQQNQGILPAANFVISIFNGLINNNPFTVLIIIVCILLIGKKVIGK